MRHEHSHKVNPRARALIEARSHDPFAILGVHRRGNTCTIRVFEPSAERAQSREWPEARELDWSLLQHELHRGMQALCRTLNRSYRDMPALHDLDFDPAGFAWIDSHDADQSVLAFERHARDGACVVVALRFTPVPRAHYRIGLPCSGVGREILNSDSHFFGGSDCGNAGAIVAEPVSWMGRPCSAAITLPPLAAIILAPESSRGVR